MAEATPVMLPVPIVAARAVSILCSLDILSPQLRLLSERNSEQNVFLIIIPAWRNTKNRVFTQKNIPENTRSKSVGAPNTALLILSMIFMISPFVTPILFIRNFFAHGVILYIYKILNDLYIQKELYLMASIKKYRPSSAGLGVIRIALILASIAVILLSKRYLSAYPIIMYTVIGIFCAAAFAIGMILLPIIFAKSTYSISDEEIQKVSGMFFISRQFMKTSCIQYITTVTTPLSKLTGLNFIIVNALGGRMILLFLSMNDALEISASLNRTIRSNREQDS